MLHKAPWLGEKMPDDAAPHLGGLAGDFFCAPFGDASADSAPGHGWPANTTWTHLGTERKGDETVARFRLDRKAMGADLVKELRLVDGHPFLYQRHIFTGGHAEGMAVANHAMVSLPNGGQLSFSPKRWWETPQMPLETDPARGRSLLACPTKATDPQHFPLAAGGEADITTLSLRLAPRGFRHRRRGRRQQARLDDGGARQGGRPLHQPAQPGTAADDHAVVLERRTRLCAVERPSCRLPRRRGRA